MVCPKLRPRILFISEAVTLAHVARATVLARRLDPSRYEVHAAWDPRYNSLLGELPFTFHSIRSLPTTDFLKRLGRGLPMHDARLLRGYVSEDLATIERVSPDLVVGDFRLSLAASARLARVPLLTVANAYWSPYARQTFLFPEYDYPLTRVIGSQLAGRLFTWYRPLAFATHTRPLNKVLRAHNLSPIGTDIRVMYTFGDYTAYADIPALVPTYDLPATHRYIGAVLWSPPVALPSWWEELPPDRPVVYATPGSSGEGDWLPAVAEALADLPVTVVAATAGRVRLARPVANTRVADFIPGSEAAGRASLVICNGGSPTSYQALAKGVPVLGITGNNMDQHLNMEAVRRAGAGEVLRARTADARAIRAEVTRMVGNPRYRQAANALARALASFGEKNRFQEFVEEILQRPGGRKVPTDW